MKLWIGAELDSDVAEPFRVARRRVEEAVNNVIVPKSYDLPLNSWDCIAIVRNDEHLSERVHYSSTSREMDFRLRIEHAAFKVASPQQQASMVFTMLQRSLALLADKLPASAPLKELEGDLHIAEASA